MIKTATFIVVIKAWLHDISYVHVFVLLLNYTLLYFADAKNISLSFPMEAEIVFLLSRPAQLTKFAALQLQQGRGKAKA